jgi:hypothetical protein
MRNVNVFRSLGVALLAGVLPGLAIPALGEAVSEDEAVAVTELRLQMEVYGPHSRLSDAEKLGWGERLVQPFVFYLVSDDVLLDEVPIDDEVLAYIVAYEPGGFAVVSGDDRLEPLLVFDPYSPFRGDRVPENFLRKFLTRNLPARWAYLWERLENGMRVGPHPNWLWLRQQLGVSEALDPDAQEGPRGGGIYVLWDTALWYQWWPYNTEVVAHNGGNSCPTGCTATAMAIQMRFHSWPPVGHGTHAYCDNEGSLQYCHSVNFGATTYSWQNMPTGNLTEENPDVAQLMYHCGVAVEMDYEPGGSGAWPSADAMNTYFRYKGTEEVGIAHEPAVIVSIIAGLPVVLSSSAHTVVACGFRDTGPEYFFLNCGWNGYNNGWYNLDQICGGDPTIDRSYPYSSPENYMFVDGDYSGLWELGMLQYPFNTISEGNAFVPVGGRLCISGGSYTGSDNVPVTFSTRMTVTSWGGTATIGGP